MSAQTAEDPPVTVVFTKVEVLSPQDALWAEGYGSTRRVIADGSYVGNLRYLRGGGYRVVWLGTGTHPVGYDTVEDARQGIALACEVKPSLLEAGETPPSGSMRSREEIAAKLADLRTRKASVTRGTGLYIQMKIEALEWVLDIAEGTLSAQL